MEKKNFSCHPPPSTFHLLIMITQKDVEHIAKLARLHLDDSTKQSLEKDLSSILAFVETLNELDTADIIPMTGGTTLTNAMHDDAEDDLSLEGKGSELLGAVPSVKDGFVKVTSIFE